MLRRQVIVTAAFAALATFVAGPTQAQEWPQKPVKLIVPFPAGGRAICQTYQLQMATSSAIFSSSR